MKICHCSLAGTQQCSLCPHNENNNIKTITTSDLTLGHSISNDNWNKTSNSWNGKSINDIKCATLMSMFINPTVPKTLKEKFIQDYENKNNRAKYIVVAVQGVDGNVDIHVHAYDLNNMFRHYCEMYYDNFELKNNVMVKVVGYMIV